MLSRQLRQWSHVAQIALVLIFASLALWFWTFSSGAEPAPVSDPLPVALSQVPPSSPNAESQHPHYTPDSDSYHTAEDSVSPTWLDVLAAQYVEAILDYNSTRFARFKCSHLAANGRYEYLRQWKHENEPQPAKKYFFALQLHRSMGILSWLMSTIVEVMGFLGPQSCVLSVVVTGTNDGSMEVCDLIKQHMDALGATVLFNSTDSISKADPGSASHTQANLRNLVLQPLTQLRDQLANNAAVIYLDPAATCPDDILELIHQQLQQEADLVCSMAWQLQDDDLLFLDVQNGRTLDGDSFLDIVRDAPLDLITKEKDLFPGDKSLYDAVQEGTPFQVYSCWSAATVFSAQPFLLGQVNFRTPLPDECPRTETEAFCKDLWIHGYGKVAVIPAVNIGHSHNQGAKVKNRKRFVEEWIRKGHVDDQIEWTTSPPEEVRCLISISEQYWKKLDNDTVPLIGGA